MSAALTDFLDALRTAPGPFAHNRVDRPSAQDVDVSAIHGPQFDRILALAEQGREQNRGAGAVLWGEPGVGKSHLLSRLSRWAGDDNQACFIYLPGMQAGAEQLPRYVLKCVVHSLTAGKVQRFHDTRLYRMINAMIKRALRGTGGTSVTIDEAESAYQDLIDQLIARDPVRAVLLDRTVFLVLFRFFRSAFLAHHQGGGEDVARVAVHWLAGDELDAEEADLLGLRRDRRQRETVTLADNQQVKLALVALAQAALIRQYPLLLCFDQVENLDDDQVKALSRFLQDLIDTAGNLLVITCGVQQRLLEFRNLHAIPQAAWDRVAQYEIDLNRISRDQSRQLLQERLKAFLQPYAEVKEVREQMAQDALFPLGTAWFDERLGGVPEFRPRDVINWARQRWEQQQKRLAEQPAERWLRRWRELDAEAGVRPQNLEAVIDAKVDQQVAEQRSQWLTLPHTLPPSSENLAGLVHALLRQGPAAPAVERFLPPRTPRSPYDLVIDPGPANGGRRTGVLFLGTGSATSTAAYLRRVVEDAEAPERLLLVTEERQPLKFGASPDAQGIRYFEELRGRGTGVFRHVEVAFEQYAGLAALQAAVGLACSGDLEVEWPAGTTRRVSEAEVVASHQRRQRYAADPLLRLLFSVEEGGSARSGKAAVLTDVTEFVRACETAVREVIMARLAIMPGASTRDLADHCIEDLRRTRRLQVDAATCHAGVKEIAERLHREGLVNANPLDDGYYLLRK